MLLLDTLDIQKELMIKMDKESWLKFGDYLAVVLTLLGAFNWLLIDFKFNLVTFLFNTVLAGVVYALIGLSAVWIFVRAVILKDFMEGRV